MSVNCTVFSCLNLAISNRIASREFAYCDWFPWSFKKSFMAIIAQSILYISRKNLFWEKIFFLQKEAFRPVKIR